jgi:hypothetical protein
MLDVLRINKKKKMDGIFLLEVPGDKIKKKLDGLLELIFSEIKINLKTMDYYTMEGGV